MGDNRIADVASIAGCLELRYLNLSGNKVASFEALAPLKVLEKLQWLDLGNCPVAALDGYRQRLFKQFPSLVALDGTNEKGEEMEDRGMNGDEDDDEEEDDDDEDDDDYESDESDESGPGLAALIGDDLLDEDADDNEDFDATRAGAEAGDDVDISDDADEDDQPPRKKRKDV